MDNLQAEDTITIKNSKINKTVLDVIIIEVPVNQLVASVEVGIFGYVDINNIDGEFTYLLNDNLLTDIVIDNPVTGKKYTLIIEDAGGGSINSFSINSAAPFSPLVEGGGAGILPQTIGIGSKDKYEFIYDGTNFYCSPFLNFT